MTNSTNNSTPRHRKVLIGLTDWSLTIAGLINLGTGTWYALQGDPTIAATSLTAGLVLMFAATIDRFESLKGLGIEAKTRKLDEKIEQADEALRRLRQLTELTGAALIDMNSKVGRFDSAPSPRESYALAERVRAIMQSLKSESSTIAAALRPWARTLCFDITHAFMKPLFLLINSKMQELINQQRAIPIQIDPNDPQHVRLTEQINLGKTYLSCTHGFHMYDLNEYPAKFSGLLENVPYLTDQELQPFREKSAKISSDMVTLNQTASLPNAEYWMCELESGR